MDKNTRNFTCIGHITQKFRQSLHISNTANYMNSSIKQVDQRQTFPEYRIAKDKLLRASPRAFVFWVSYLKKEKKDKKTHIQQILYLHRLLFSFSIQRVPLAIFA